MLTSLRDHVLKFVKPSEKELQLLLDAVETEVISNKQYLIKEGQYCLHLYFIVQGCFRSYFIHTSGAEKVINFGIEDWWITDFDSLIHNRPSELHIQAAEDSVVLKISKQKLDLLLQESIVINQYFRMIHEKVRIADQRRIKFMYSLSGEELYHSFCEHNPKFVQRVPQYMLASYLGFTPEFLSKIRARKKK